MPVPERRPLMTAEELFELPDSSRYELVDGKLVRAVRRLFP